MGSSGFEVAPGSLRGGSVRAAALRSGLASMRGGLGSAAAGVAGCPPGARAAVGASCEEWSRALEGLAVRAEQLELNLGGAAGAYEATDRSAMPGRGG